MIMKTDGNSGNMGQMPSCTLHVDSRRLTVCTSRCAPEAFNQVQIQQFRVWKVDLYTTPLFFLLQLLLLSTSPFQVDSSQAATLYTYFSLIQHPFRCSGWTVSVFEQPTKVYRSPSKDVQQNHSCWPISIFLVWRKDHKSQCEKSKNGTPYHLEITFHHPQTSTLGV